MDGPGILAGLEEIYFSSPHCSLSYIKNIIAIHEYSLSMKCGFE